MGLDHNPLTPTCPPLREGHHSGPNGLANSDLEPPLAPPSPPQNPLPSCSFLLLFSPALSLLFVCCFFSLFKLAYRTRWEAACGKALSLLSFDDVISVAVPQRTLFLRRGKKASSFFIIFFYVLYLSQSFSFFFFCK